MPIPILNDIFLIKLGYKTAKALSIVERDHASLMRGSSSKFHIVMGESFSGSVAGARFATHEDIAYIKRALSIISSFMPQGSSELPWS